MGNVRFIRAVQNFGRKVSSASTYPVLVNGNGSFVGAPALRETAPFSMSNALLPDRNANVWVSTTTPNNATEVVVEIAVGATARSIRAAAVLGFSPIAGSFPSSVGVEYLVGPTYSTSGWVNALPLITFGGARDAGIVFAPISARFWRFRFYSPINPFSVASFVLAGSIDDLGFLYSGSQESLVVPKSFVEQYGRTPIVARTGLSFRRWTHSYTNVDPATRSIFDALVANETAAFVYVAPDDRFWEVIPDGDEFARSHVWSPPDRYSFSFAFRSLP